MIGIMNRRLLPTLKLSPRELMFGMVVNTKPTPVDDSLLPLTQADAELNMVYVAQQHLDGYTEAVNNAQKRKRAFDKNILKRSLGEVVFTPGDLVQIYRTDLDYTFKTERKLLPKWSQPHRVVSCNVNSYKIETLDGVAVAGDFSAWRLRQFELREETRLAGEEAARRERGFSEEGLGVRGSTVKATRTPPREGGAHGVSLHDAPLQGHT
ncbi:hypothetical protein H0H92_012140 [Tricholoma furcatifolium]|nr:hypothetical protein H0H92_012140 [Tricholoma furcatifolium]